jgi:UPF0271 protein
MCRIVGASPAWPPQAMEALETICSSSSSLPMPSPRSALRSMAVGVPLIREAYADRAYHPDGLLVPRNQEGAVIHDADAVVARCLRLAQHGEIVAIDGSVMKSEARSICLHGDTPGAVDLAREIRYALEAEGIVIAAGDPVASAADLGH